MRKDSVETSGWYESWLTVEAAKAIREKSWLFAFVIGKSRGMMPPKDVVGPMLVIWACLCLTFGAVSGTCIWGALAVAPGLAALMLTHWAITILFARKFLRVLVAEGFTYPGRTLPGNLYLWFPILLVKGVWVCLIQPLIVGSKYLAKRFSSWMDRDTGQTYFEKEILIAERKQELAELQLKHNEGELALADEDDGGGLSLNETS